MPYLVRKSFIPGKGYLRALDVGKEGLKHAAKERPDALIRARKKAAKESAEAKDFAGQVSDAASGFKEYGKATTKGNVTTIDLDLAPSFDLRAAGTEGLTFRQGSKSRGHSTVVLPKGAANYTQKHEMAHATPKRSGYRLMQVINDPKKLAREEARAEMSSGKPTAYWRHPSRVDDDSAYVRAARGGEQRRTAYALTDGPMKGIYSKEGQKAFRETQDKIAGAQGRKTPKSPFKRAFNPVRDNPSYSLIGGGVGLAAGVTYNDRRNARGAKFRGNQHMDRNGQRRRSISKSFEFLEMGGAMVEPERIEENKRTEKIESIRVRDLNTGRFVAGPSLLKGD